MSSYLNPWVFDSSEVDSENITEYQGFVYLIEELSSGRKYIGKKNFWVVRTSIKTDKVTKKKKKIRKKLESDWKSYYGSNKELQKLVSENGESNYSRKILHLCKTKSEMSYFELKEQMDNRVLESNEFFNDWIMVRIRKDQLKMAEHGPEV